MKKKVAVIFNNYLPISQVFNYLELKYLRKVRPIVCAKKINNLSKFPFKPIYPYNGMNKLKKILIKEKADLIHARFGTNGINLLNMKKELDIPMLTSFHGYDLPTNHKLGSNYKKKLKKLFKVCEAFTATSINMKEILIKYGCPHEKIFVHHSGVDLSKFKYNSRIMPLDKTINILSIGRLVEKKGMKYLITAFSNVLKEYPQVQLRIVGDGHLYKSLIKQVNDLNMTDKITFLGAISHHEVLAEMGRAHLFVLASVSDSGNQEGIPNVIKEAMACGIPVVSTFHAGIPELVDNENSGLLVPERDPSKLSASILKLIHQPDLWEEMGVAGRNIVNKSFNVETQVKELEKIYEQIISKNF